MKLLRSTRGRIGLAAIWFALIWIMSSIPGKELPSSRILGMDKLAHISVYFVLGVLVNGSFVLCKPDRIKISLVYALLVLSAALDEYHQIYIPGRSVSVYDLIANISGLSFPYLWIMLRAGKQSRD